MKRPKLKQSLQRLQVESSKRKAQKAHQKQLESNHKNTKGKIDTRILWHHWSDERRTLTPYRGEMNSIILVVGDGDFSFSKALSEIIPAEQLVCTAYDSFEEIQKKYPGCDEHVKELKVSGATVLFDFDATQMSLKLIAGRSGKKVPRIRRIIFNFPHTGDGIKDRDLNIRAQQTLLLQFLKCSAGILKEQSEFYKDKELLTRKTVMASPNIKEDLDVEDGLGGTPQQPEIHLTTWSGDPYDDWNVKGLASSTDQLQLIESFNFEASRYAGYEHRRTIGFVMEDTFTNRTARTFVFGLK